MSSLSPRRELTLSEWMCSIALLLLPCATLFLIAYRTEMLPLFVGAGVQAVFAIVFVRAHPVWRPPVSASLIVLYFIGLIWLWLPTRGMNDWTIHVGVGLFLIVAVGIAAIHELIRTGIEPLRRATRLCSRLLKRRSWPVQLFDCRNLPEVAALRDAVRDEARPVLPLLSDPRPEVRCSAMCALEYRPRWQPGEAELVLETARNSIEPPVRVAAAFALAHVESAELIAGLTEFLRDPNPEVRSAAASALLWDLDIRWPHARDGVRGAMADPKLAEDGPLFATGRLTGAAIADMITWSEERAPLARRAIHTLIEQYHRDLLDGERHELGSQLAAMILSHDVPPVLRVELASLLREHHLLTPDLLDRLTNMDQPGPIRLFAAEQMLRINPHDPDGVDVLRGLARQPNREIAIAVATVLQHVLGLDLGMPDDELPLPNSKLGAELARRVQMWANGATAEMIRSVGQPAAAVRGANRATMPAGSRLPTGLMPATPFPPRPSPLPDDSLPTSTREDNDSSAVFGK